MRKIYLVRHAKSSWDNPYLEDFDRPLNKRGKSAAPEMGRRLVEKGIMPDLIISSPALRAAKTAKKICKEIGYDPERIRFYESLYHAGKSTIIQLIKSLDHQVESLMIFGHNPGFNDFASFFIPEFDENIPTCGVFAINFRISSWSEIEPAQAKLEFFDYPKRKVSQEL